MNVTQRAVRITKRFTFEMAHALSDHDGACAGIHGHSYVLDITLEGVPMNDPGHPKDGLVIDFADLKRIVQHAVIDRYDHALVLHERERMNTALDAALFARMVFTPWQPSCENLLLDIVDRLLPVIGTPLRLYHVCLQETATSRAEWGPD